MSEDEKDALLTEAEERIQEILLDLKNEHGLKIESIDADTRPFGNCRVNIMVTP